MKDVYRVMNAVKNDARLRGALLSGDGSRRREAFVRAGLVVEKAAVSSVKSSFGEALEADVNTSSMTCLRCIVCL